MSTRSGRAEIYTMNANGSGVTKITNSLAIDAEPAWGMNNKILFTTFGQLNFDVYSMNSDGTGVLRLTNQRSWDISPHW